MHKCVVIWKTTYEMDLTMIPLNMLFKQTPFQFIRIFYFIFLVLLQKTDSNYWEKNEQMKAEKTENKEESGIKWNKTRKWKKQIICSKREWITSDHKWSWERVFRVKKWKKNTRNACDLI